MKIKTKTSSEAATAREAWKPLFALFPVKVDDGDWRWLEVVEYRELTTVRNHVCTTTIQRRAIGSDKFWPPYPFKAGEVATKERRANRGLNYPHIEVEPRSEYECVAYPREGEA